MLVKEFIKKNYINDPGPKGSLARGIKADGVGFPTRSKKKTLRDYLEKYCDASDGVLKAFDECYEEWKLYEAKRKSDRAKTRKSG